MLQHTLVYQSRLGVGMGGLGGDWNFQLVGMFWVGWLILCDTASVVDDPYATSGWVIDVMWSI